MFALTYKRIVAKNYVMNNIIKLHKTLFTSHKSHWRLKSHVKRVEIAHCWSSRSSIFTFRFSLFTRWFNVKDKNVIKAFARHCQSIYSQLPTKTWRRPALHMAKAFSRRQDFPARLVPQLLSLSLSSMLFLLLSLSLSLSVEDQVKRQRWAVVGSISSASNSNASEAQSNWQLYETLTLTPTPTPTLSVSVALENSFRYPHRTVASPAGSCNLNLSVSTFGFNCN